MQAKKNEFLETLRSRTNDNHKALEQVNVSAVLMSDAVTIKDYQHYLELMYGFVKGFEAYVFPIVTETIPELKGRQKIDWLTTDLEKLNVDINNIPVIDTVALQDIYPAANAALGGFYVMEGSTLGGQIISRHLEKKLGDAVAGKLTYIKAYADQTGPMWKSFLEIFCAAAEKNNAEADVIEAAVKTFKLLEDWLLSQQKN